MAGAGTGATAEASTGATIGDGSRATRLIYGSGAAAFGIKDNGFSYLLLIFYNQVLGLPAALVGGAIMLALFADALADPLIGYASDRTRGRLGRRHPWMYAAAVPAALAYWALWNPPAGLGEQALLGWLLALAVATRLSISCFEIPNAAMVAELSQDYDARTRIIGWRFLFGWAGGIAAGVAAFALFLTPTPAQPVGVLNPRGYAGYSVAAALGMLAFMLLSSAGTHRLIPSMRRAEASEPNREPLTLGRRLAAVKRALANPPFLAVLSAGLFASMAAGLAGALNVYFQTWFWGLTSAQISLVILSALLSAALALPLATRLSARWGKRRAAMTTFLAGIALAPAMLLLRLADLLPANGAPALLPLLIAHSVLFVTLVVAAAILITSMLTDTVEVHEVATGERVEGFYFAANFFVQKLVSGLGIGLSGLVIAAAGLPRQMDATPPAEALTRLALLYIPLLTVGWLLALACLSRYRLDRDAHLANLARLKAP